MKNCSTRLFLLGLATVSPFIAASSVRASDIVIDGFLTPQEVFFTPFQPFLPDFSEVAAPEALGGFRDLQVMGNGSFASTQGTVMPNGGALSFSNNDLITGTLIATYDGNDGSPTVNSMGLGGIDLTDMGSLDRLTVSLTSADLMGLEVTLNLFSGTGNATVTDTFAHDSDELNFSFSDIGFASVDFTDIGAIQLILTGPASIDASIDLFAATSSTDVPEPAISLWLFGTAIAGSLSLRRRTRSA